MKNILKKVALVSAFAFTLGIGTVIGVNLNNIDDYSITANAEDITYTVQNIATIQDDEDFKNDYFGRCNKVYYKMIINQNTNTLYYVDNTKVYEYNIYTNKSNCILNTEDMSVKNEGTTSQLTNFIIYKLVTNPYNNHVYAIGYFEDKNGNHNGATDYIYDITTQTYYNAYYITQNKYSYFYDKNTLYTYMDKYNVSKYDFSKNEFVKNPDLSIMEVNTYSDFHSIFERDNGFYYINQKSDYAQTMEIYYSGTFANENPELILTITNSDFENYINGNHNYKDFNYLNIYTIYNKEPYILDGRCGDVYRVDIDNNELVKYINGADVVQTGRTYFSEDICDLLMSKDGEPIFYDWKDYTIKIFKSDATPTVPDVPDTPTEYSRFDVNRDGSVNILDLIELKRYLINLIKE